MKHLRLTLNLGGKPAERIRENGKWYLVAPVSMLVGDRVLHGSKGRLFYPRNEVAKSPGAWNNVPITHNHPSYFGTPVSVSHSTTVRKIFEIGTVRSDHWDGRRRTAMAWFDEAVTRNKAPAVYDALISGEAMEVSTGLFTDDEEVSGYAPDGQPYDAVARGPYLPDHLAVLPNTRGACSNQDGCGLNVNALNPSHNCSRRTKMTRKTDPEWLLEAPANDLAANASPALTGNCSGGTGKKNSKRRPQDDDLILEVPTTNWAEVAASQDR